MNSQIKQIAERLRGLRDALDLTQEDVAAKCNISVETLSRFESGEHDIPISFICEIANAYGIETSAIITGEEPNMSSYWLTRKGQGTVVERSKAYRYESLAMGFKNAKAEPFIVTVDPKDSGISVNAHSGQEFCMVLEGTMLVSINGKEITLNEGDSIFFDATKAHGMQALKNKPVKIIALVM